MKILIVEDEFIIAQSLSTTLEKSDHEIVSICSTYDEVVSHLSQALPPDIIIIDIKLRGNKSGIDLAEFINKNYDLPFIFLTSITDEHLLNSLKYLNPSSILIKPFNKHELNATLQLIKYQTEQKELNKKQSDIISDSIFIKHKSEHIRILFSNILYIKSSDVYLVLKTTNNTTYQFRGTLESYSNKLNQHFLRVHRSFIVNTQHIDKVYKEHLLIDSDIIPVGNTYKPNVFNLLKLN